MIAVLGWVVFFADLIAVCALWCMYCAGWFQPSYFARNDPLIRQTCKVCDGYGIRILHEGQKQNLTPGIRDRRKHVWSWGAPLANKVSCHNCRGLGFTWQKKTRHNSHRYMR